MTKDILTSLLPSLSSSSRAEFNVFDVMRHGTAEKQISNVFAWLLDPGGTHGLGDLFQQVFIEHVNQDRAEGDWFSERPYVVRQEVNTTESQSTADIADLVLDSHSERIVVENYLSSDGHGHSHASYLDLAQRDNRKGGVVLLCRYHDSHRQTDGWEQASVLTYEALIASLRKKLPASYPQRHPESDSFLQQMDRKFGRSIRRMEDKEVLSFLVAMADSGEAGRYQENPAENAKDRFAADVAELAKVRFEHGYKLLTRIKRSLKDYCSGALQAQLNGTMGGGFVSGTNTRYQGIYQWTVNFRVDSEGPENAEAGLQVKFGPSAWFANEQDPDFLRKVDPEAADYSHLFITRFSCREIRQSTVTLEEVLDGLQPDDRRLHDEIVDLLGPPPG